MDFKSFFVFLCEMFVCWGWGVGGGVEVGKIVDCCVGDMGFILEGFRRYRGVCVDI